MFTTAKQDDGLPFVTIVIPTLNRKKSLKNCLNSLLKMDYPRSKFEIIVVDNGSVDGTKEMIQRNFPEVRIILEKTKGVVYARNAGIKHAKGVIVAFTDDDCVVDSDWLRSLVSGFTSKEIGAVGGPVFHLHPEFLPKKFWCSRTRPVYFGEKNRLVTLENEENGLVTLVTGNLAVKREVFKVINFDESLVFHDSEDIDFCLSLMEAGYKLLYISNAKVYHNVDPKRASIQYILKRAFFGGISLYMIERKRRSKVMLIPRFLRAFLVGLLNFFHGREVENLYWFVECFAAFLSSIFLISRS